MSKAGAAEVLNPDAWKAGLRFALKSLNTNTVKRASVPDEVLLVCLRHNLRKDNHDHRHRRPLDPERMKLNSVLRGSTEPSICAELASSILDELGIAPARQDAIMAIELVFQPQPHSDVPEFYQTCLQWVLGRYAHIVSAVVHRDQMRPHMHVLVLAVRDGRLDGAAMTSNGNRWQAQRSEFMRHMRAELGLRPDRTARSLAHIFTSAGKGPKTHATAAKSDDAMMARAAAKPRDLIAHQPHSPPDLIAPTSYCAVLPDTNRLSQPTAFTGSIPRTPTVRPTPAPWPPTQPPTPSPERRQPTLLADRSPASAPTSRTTACSPWRCPWVIGWTVPRQVAAEAATSRSANATTRMGRLLSARVRYGMQPGYREARELLVPRPCAEYE